MYTIFAFCSSFVMAMILLPWVVKHAYKKELTSIRSEVEERKNKVVRLGGAIILPCIIVGTILSLVLMSEGEDISKNIKSTTLLSGAGVMLIYLIGLLDDLFGLPAKLRLFVQLLAAVSLPICDLCINNFYGIAGIWDLPYYLSIIVTVFVVVAIINAINMIDGIDGLLSSYVILCLLCFGFCFWQIENYIYTYVSASMIGALLVFFYYNMFGTLEKKTKTFMGDGGSMVFGFTLAYLSIKYINSNSLISYETNDRVVMCITLLFVPCVDLLRVFLERIMHGEHPFAADKRHIHHRFMEAGFFGKYTLICVLCIVIFYIITNTLLTFVVHCTISQILVIDIIIYFVFNVLLDYKIRLYRNRMALASDVRERFYAKLRSAKKICILTPRFPVPENGGDVLRINNIARHLKREGYSLILVSFEDDGSPQIFEAKRIYDKVYTIHRNKLYSLLQSVIFMLSGRAMQCGYYYSAEFKKTLTRVIRKEQPDLYIAHLLRMMPYLDGLKLHDSSIIEMTDALSKTYSLSSKSKGNVCLKYIYAIEQHLIRRAEQYSMLHFPVNVLVSASDVDYLSKLSPHNASLVVHSNGVEVLPNFLTEYDANKIVFIGNMRTLQNQDAVLYFVNDVFPRILSHIPQAKFYIVGSQPSQKILELASDNIIVTGFVDDLASSISDSAIAVAPVRVAAGIQNKVLVAMGCGLPVVLTELISKAIPELVDEVNCVIRDEAATIADSCVRIMKKKELRNSIALAGYNMVKQCYGWEEKLKGYVTK